MRLKNIGIFLLLIIIFCIIVICDGKTNEQNSTLQTLENVEATNQTIVTTDNDSDDDDSDIIYVCGGNGFSDTRCSCFDNTLDCEGGVVFDSNELPHLKIKIRKENFILKYVNLSQNKLKILKKNEILPGHEATIKELNFNSNDIEAIDDGVFEKFTLLKKLNLGFNSLTNLSTNVFQHLKKLHHLDIGFNREINLVSKINGINTTIFPEALSSLKELILASCNIEYFDENVFINLRNLETLDVSRNLFTTIPKSIKSLSNLVNFFSGYSQITAVYDCDFCGLKHLKKLYLQYSSRLKYFDENAFGALNNNSTMPQVAEILMHYCKVAVLPEKLLNWKNVSRIDIERNPLACNCSMAWFINDYNATSPIIVDKLLKIWYRPYKNKLKCYSPSSLVGTHLHTLGGDFCKNETSVNDEIEKDEVYYVCGKNTDEEDSKEIFNGCFCNEERLICQPWNNKKLNHTNIRILQKNFTIIEASLSENNITSLKKGKVLPGHEHTITYLSLDSNNISHIDNETFENFSVLNGLILNENNLTNIDHIKFPSTLERLSLRSTNLGRFPRIDFSNITGLNIGLNPKMFTTSLILPESLSNLKILLLSSCNISSLHDDTFINLRNLQALYLSDNPFTSIPTAINALQNLNYLNLNQINIENLTFNGLKVHRKLKSISFINSKIQRVDDCAFCNFPNLEEVYFKNSKNLTFIHENAFGAVSNEKPIQLQKFSIRSCNVSILPEKLLNWQNVSRIDIERNPLTCNCSMAWLINDYNASTPLYVNNLRSFWGWSSENYKSDLYCHSPPELKNEQFYKLSGDFCLNESTETDVEEEQKYLVCGGDERDSPCTCAKKKLECTSLDGTNILILNGSIEIEEIEIVSGNISKLNLDKFLPEKQHSIINLKFWYDKIRVIENGTFNNFTTLQRLELYSNSLEKIDENILTKELGSTLTELKLDFNDLVSLSPKTFMYLTKLEILSLSGNPNLGHSFSSEIFSKSLSSLLFLSLSSCNISILKDDTFINLPNLIYLCLSGNPLTTFPKAINPLSNLQVLELGFTEITVLKNNGLKQNKKLRYLYASYSKLQRVEECAFCSFPNLALLSLNHNKNLSFINENAFGLAHSHMKPALFGLEIQGCNLTTLPEKLLNWTSLKYFHASGNPLICDCSMNWFFKYVKSKHFYFHCQSPAELKGKTFHEISDLDCNETLIVSTTPALQTSTIPSPITVTDKSISDNNTWIWSIFYLSIVIIAALIVIVFAGFYYYRNRRAVIQIQQNQSGEDDLLEEDFDTVNV